MADLPNDQPPITLAMIKKAAKDAWDRGYEPQPIIVPQRLRDRVYERCLEIDPSATYADADSAIQWFTRRGAATEIGRKVWDDGWGQKKDG